MKEVRLDGTILPLALRFETMKPIKDLCAACKEEKV